MTEQMATEPETKRFFIIHECIHGDGGAFWLVATSLDHARQLLRECGVEFVADDGKSYPIDHPSVAAIPCKEISADAATGILCHHDDDLKSPTTPLAQCEIGDWFYRE